MMSTLRSHALRMLHLFERMRHRPPSPAMRRLAELNLSHSHLRLVQLLAPDRTLAMKELADELQLTPPSITALTRRLAQTGLVARQPHAEDSRVALLSLTDAGRRLHQQLYEEQLGHMQYLLASLSDEEQLLFLDLLDRATRPADEREQAALADDAATPLDDISL
jgi:DNA-binding MarR family transcriptional regulator